MSKRGIVLIFSLAAFCVVVAGASALADPGKTTREFFQERDLFYQDLMPLKPHQTSGTGFKPYQRYKWLVEPRLAETGNLIPGARWAAWEQLRQMEQNQGRGGQTWFTLGPTNVAGRCLCLEVHPTDSDIVYAGFASGGLWKTIDSGTTWIPLGDDLPSMAIGCMEIDPNDPDRMWIGTGEGWGNIDAIHGNGVMISLDGGVSFAPTALNYTLGQGRDIFELEYNPVTGTLLAGADNGLWRSTDAGVSFTNITTGSVYDVEMKKGSSSIAFYSKAGGGAGIYRSTDDGLTWTILSNGTPTTGIGNNRFALTDADPNRIIWAIADPTTGGTKGHWRSTDGGDSWTQSFAGNHYGGQGWYDLTIEISPATVQTVYSGGVNYFRSTNGGTSFSTHAGNVHVDHHASAWNPNDDTNFWIGSDGGVWESTNGGTTFAARNTGLTTLQFYAMGQSETLITRALGGTQDNGTYKYDGSTAWVGILGGDGFQCEVDYGNEQTVYAELYFGEHYRSLTGGGGMLPINSGITQDGPWETPTFMDFSDPFILYAMHSNTVYKTTNRGSNWTAMTTIPGGGRSMHQSRTDPNFMVIIGSSQVWVTTNHGTTWEQRTNGLAGGGALSDVCVDPSDPNIIVLTGKTYSLSFNQLHKTTNQGASWFAIDSTLPDEPMNSIEIDPSNPDWYFVGSDLAVYVSFDAGANFQPFNNGLPHTVHEDIRIHDGSRFLRSATHGRGMWEVDISDLSPTSVETNQWTTQPLTLRVLGNPATDQTTLRFGIRQAGLVRLGLYDLQGRQVRSLVDRFMQPIVEDAELDLRGLPTGVYFARLDANGATVSKKVIVGR